MTTTRAASGLVVLQSYGESKERKNPFTRQLSDALAPHCTVLPFSWRRALIGRVDVFHVHWPEVLLRGGSILRTWRRYVLFALLMVRLRLTRGAIVRTRHNLIPHEQGPRVERALLRWLDSRTALWISLSGVEESTPRQRSVTIRHGHYRDWFRDHPEVPAVDGRLLFFGTIREYKGVEQLIDLVCREPTAEVDLRIVGLPYSEGLAAHIDRACAQSDRITARLEEVSDAELAAEIYRSQLVVLPYREMLNSGAALLALSLDRPILVPATPVNAALADEVGADWVHTFDPPLEHDRLSGTLQRARECRPAYRPDLSRRDWRLLAEEHMAAYRAARERD